MHNLADLSFAVKSPTGQIDCLWNPRPDLDWSSGNAEGRRRADEVVARMRIDEAPALLNHVVRAIIEQGLSGSVETGFFSRIAQLAMESEVPLSVAGGRPVLSLVGNDA